MYLKYKTIACDFDGTIAYDAYPDVGEFKPHAIRVLKKIKEYGGTLIIWTCRTGDHAEEVKRRLTNAGVEYDAFNDNIPNPYYPDNSRKVFADVYLDDRANFIEEIDWLWIESKLFTEGSGEFEQA